MQVGGVPRGAARVCAVGSWQDARKRPNRPDDGGAEATPLAGPPPKRQKQVSNPDCFRLNKLICSANSYDDLTTIISRHHSEFNGVNTATACSQLAKKKDI